MTYWIILMQGMAFIFVALGGLVVVMNWMMVIETRRTGRCHSTAPLVGAGFLGAGLALLPQTRSYAWAAILADCGTLQLLVYLPHIVMDVWKTSRFNLVAEYGGGRGTLTARIRLYRRGIFVIQHDLNRPPGELGIVGRSMVGTWNQDGQALTLEVGDNSALFNVVVDGETEFLQQLNGLSPDMNSEMSLAGVTLLRRRA